MFVNVNRDVDKISNHGFPSAAKPQPKERGLQSAGRLINEQGWGIVQRVLSELTFRRNKFRAPKIVAVRDDLDR